MNREMARVNRTVDWLPDASSFDNTPLDAPTYKHLVELCKAHLLDKKSLDKQTEALFAACFKPRTSWEAVVQEPGKVTKVQAAKAATDYETALKALKKNLAAMQPKYSAKHPRAGEAHDGMVAYIKSATTRIGDEKSGLIKDVRDSLAAGTYKSA